MPAYTGIGPEDKRFGDIAVICECAAKLPNGLASSFYRIGDCAITAFKRRGIAAYSLADLVERPTGHEPVPAYESWVVWAAGSWSIPFVVGKFILILSLDLHAMYPE